MNKLLFYLLFLFTFFSFAQNEGSNFELKYHPSNEYSSELKKFTNLKTEKKVDNETQKYFDSLGVKRVQKGRKKESHKILIISKERDKKQVIPIEILLYDYSYNGSFNNEKIDSEIENKSYKIKGSTDSSNNIVVNEILVDDKVLSNQLLRQIDYIEPEIKFPKHKVKIGENVVFEHSVFYNVPLNKETLYSAKCVATLIKIRKGIAYFKISSIPVIMHNNYELVVSGNLSFNIEKNFAQSFSLKSKLVINEIIDNDFIYIHNYTERIKVKTKMKYTSW